MNSLVARRGEEEPAIECPICVTPVERRGRDELFATFCCGCGALLVIAVDESRPGSARVVPAGRLSGTNKDLACKLFLQMPLAPAEIVELVVDLEGR